jgi:hypothetical protein
MGDLGDKPVQFRKKGWDISFLPSQELDCKQDVNIQDVMLHRAACHAKV